MDLNCLRHEIEVNWESISQEEDIDHLDRNKSWRFHVCINWKCKESIRKLFSELSLGDILYTNINQKYMKKVLIVEHFHCHAVYVNELV